MTGFGRSHQRLLLPVMTKGIKETQWPPWVKIALEAVRLAPSAVNRQPWGFQVEPDAIIISVRTGGSEFNVSKRLDCGIAMLHLEVAAAAYGISGKWELLEAPRVARFTTLDKLD